MPRLPKSGVPATRHALSIAIAAIVSEDGLVLFGGHSMGTTWTGVYAAYDFDDRPGFVDAGYQSVDGLVLFEGGGPNEPDLDAPDLATYLAEVEALASEGGPDVYLADFSGVIPPTLGPAAEISGLAGVHRPDQQSIVQQTPVFGGPPFNIIIEAPTTNEGIVGLFLDDDFEPFTAFRASLGFTDNFLNNYLAGGGGFGDFYLAVGLPGGLREWKHFDDPTLPVCGPGDDKTLSPGCAILDNGPRPAPDAPPQIWGIEAEVTDIQEVLSLLFVDSNFSEWYFLSGRTNLDLSFDRDSSALVAEHLAQTGGVSEGPLVVTQNANVNIPVLCIGGSNGLTPVESSFADYLGSIATPAEDVEIFIAEGYAHLDVLTAQDNLALPPLVDWINRLLQKKLLESF